MNRAKHTPGPWARHEGSVHAMDVSLIAQCSNNNGWEVAQMNAALISAAPDLLAVVRDALGLMTDNSPEIQALRARSLAAIAKAGGKS